MIYGFGGKLSGGKTCTSIRYALENIGEKRLITNFQMKNIKVPYQYVSNKEFVEFLAKNYMNSELIKQKFSQSVLILDEIVNLISSRGSSSALNELITNFMMMVGKLNTDVIYTYQVYESQVDVRMREITNINGNCFRCEQDGTPILFGARKLNTPIMILVVMEYDLGFLGKRKVIDFYDPSEYFDLYDTEEMVLLDRWIYGKDELKNIKVSK